MARKDTSSRVLGTKEQRPKPFEEMGSPGTAIFGGFIVENEKDPTLTGRQKYTTYSDILANTSIVAAGVRFFLNLVSKAGWKVEPADDSAEAQRYADLVQEIVFEGMDTPWHRVVRRAAMYRFYGFSLQEWIAKRREDGSVGMSDIEPRPQLTIEQWDVEDSGNVLGVVQRNPQNGQDIYLPRAKLVYMCDDSLNDSPEGLGLFRHLVKAAKRLEKYELLETWGFESDLRGIPVARIPLAKIEQLVKEKKLTAEQAKALRAPFESFIDKHGKNPSMGILMDSAVYRSEGEQKSPSGTPLWAVELLKGDGGPQTEMAAAIERLNRELARVLGVEQLLLGSDSKGSHALATDKTQSFGMIVDSTLVEMREQFRKDILGPLWNLNSWPEEMKPRFKTESIQYRDVAQIVSALEGLAKAGAPLAPNDPAINEVRAQVGITDAPEQDLSVPAPGEEGEQPKPGQAADEEEPKPTDEEEEPEEGDEEAVEKVEQPRHPAGTPVGGQFAPKGGVSFSSRVGGIIITGPDGESLGYLTRADYGQGTGKGWVSLTHEPIEGKGSFLNRKSQWEPPYVTPWGSKKEAERGVTEAFGKRAYARYPAGSAVGGQFAPKGGGGAAGGPSPMFDESQKMAMRQIEGALRAKGKDGAAAMGLLSGIRHNGTSKGSVNRLKGELVRLKMYNELYALDVVGG